MVPGIFQRRRLTLASVSLGALAALVLGLIPGGNDAQADEGFLRIEAITISASDQNHDQWINLLAYGKGSVNGPLAPAAAGGATATPPKVSDLTVVKEVDASTPKLAEACATGRHVPHARVEFVRAGTGVVYAVFEMEDVLISSYLFQGNNGGDAVPHEQVTLNFTKVRLAVADRGMTHVWETTFDVRTGKVGYSMTPLTNIRPTIAAIPTQIGTVGTSFSFPVQIADGDTPVDTLSLSGTSDNPALLPSDTFSFSGTGNSRQVIVTPAAGTSGLAQASITVSDGVSSATTYFLIVVSPNDGPNIILSPGSVQEHRPAGTYVGKLEMQPFSSTGGFELLDSAAGTFRLEGNQVVVNDPFLLDFETAPRPVIVVRARDTLGNPTRTVAITIIVEDLLEGPFDLWRVSNFTAAELLDPSTSGPYANPGSGPYNNLFRYALGLPAHGGEVPTDVIPRLGEIQLGGVIYATLTYRRVTATVDPLLSVEAEASDDLFNWACGPEHFILVSVTPLPGNLEEITLRTTLPKHLLGKEYMRVRVLR